MIEVLALVGLGLVIAAFFIVRRRKRAQADAFMRAAADWTPNDGARQNESDALDRQIAAERRRARQLNIPQATIDRHVKTATAKGMSELRALQKLNDDIVRDRARHRA